MGNISSSSSKIASRLRKVPFEILITQGNQYLQAQQSDIALQYFDAALLQYPDHPGHVELLKNKLGVLQALNRPKDGFSFDKISSSFNF